MTEIIPRVDAEVVVEINRLHALVQSSYASTVERAIECGRLLAEAKQRVAHGEWLPWLAEHFDGDRSTAAGYMRLAQESAKPNVERVTHLSLRAALRAIARPAGKESPLSDKQLSQLLPGLTAEPTASHTERVVDATVVTEPPGVLDDDSQRRKWEIATSAIDGARGLMDEAASEGLAPPSVASALRDASHGLRRGAKALEELSLLLEAQDARQRERAA